MSVSLAHPLPRSALLVTGLAVSLELRLLVAGDAGARSPSAGIVFALALLAVAVWGGWHPGRVRVSHAAVGVLGASVLLLVPAWLRFSGVVPPADLPLDSFLSWATIVSAVAIAEEVLLRGVLFSLLQRLGGVITAVAATSILFALLHVPLYGWSALPLDLAVGVWLGGLRVITGTVTAPAVAHTLADLATWWLV